jgi:type IV secretory pathway component VirB8
MIALESYRQAVENNRLLQKVVIALIVLCVALSLAIATLFPLKETKYKLYEFSSSGQTFRLIDDASRS